MTGVHYSQALTNDALKRDFLAKCGFMVVRAKCGTAEGDAERREWLFAFWNEKM